MIHKKGVRLFVTFHTTADAMAFERACRTAGVDGRLAPVPRSITSDCGIAWETEPPLRDALADIIKRERLNTAGICEREV
ncbi:MAG: DUF3343 domain-containing protein [Oscillospiraceae bacterium]|nr:DUF3343 domain-containing protein [Oscillospiraceae bacterium]